MIKALVLFVSFAPSVSAFSTGYNLTSKEIIDSLSVTPEHERPPPQGVFPNPNNGLGNVCFTDGGKGSSIPSAALELNRRNYNLEAVQCKTKEQLVSILGGVGLGLKSGSYVCKLFPHPYAQVSAVVMDGSANVFAWLTFGASVLDCKDDTRIELLLSACDELQKQGIKCRAIARKPLST
ncbi:hypothetical protein [Pseudobacteriovorax antillogorgiicola]|uniref:Uncharacterized protein n=1 Tax=Pseudobacteriovorax antillogorgiicola TaxID=1513793 RepID=A0A1Y6BFI4_9BACT|nr:hypothetical protein [Pseudobacteriovorax antillogorgiicola]TCS56302.1 hypothetical protein EDD56_104124 [Pseudobacteriovorax antillogorgiicola]SMF07325.1 hypothetical protein SAMN06296036_104209 [Pseudobacteriovorax antillogorgiicola]